MPNGTARELGVDLFNETRPSTYPGELTTRVEQVRVGSNNILILRGVVLNPQQNEQGIQEYMPTGDQLFLVLPELSPDFNPNPVQALDNKGKVILEGDGRFSIIVFQIGDKRIPIAQATSEQVAAARALLSHVNPDPRLAECIQDALRTIGDEVDRYGHFRDFLSASIAELAGIRGTVDGEYIQTEAGSLFRAPEIVEAVPALLHNPFWEGGRSVDGLPLFKRIDLIASAERLLLRDVLDARNASAQGITLPRQHDGLSFERGKPFAEETPDTLLQTIAGEEITSVSLVGEDRPIAARYKGQIQKFHPFIGMDIQVNNGRTVRVYRVNGGVLISHPTLQGDFRFVPAMQYPILL